MCVCSVTPSDLPPCWDSIRCQNKPLQTHWLQVVQRFISHQGISEQSPWMTGPLRRKLSDAWVGTERLRERGRVGGREEQEGQGR